MRSVGAVSYRLETWQRGEPPTPYIDLEYLPPVCLFGLRHLAAYFILDLTMNPNYLRITSPLYYCVLQGWDKHHKSCDE